MNTSLAFCVRSLLPKLNATDFERMGVRLVDATPNYLCDASAMTRIRTQAADPSALRFVVLVRDPLRRAFSEWAMFRQWRGWETGGFNATLAKQVAELRACNETLADRVGSLPSLSVSELSRYLRRCFGTGEARRYASNSLSAVCILHALRLFDRRQFLFLRQEELNSTAAVALLIGRIARFVGLYTDEGVTAAATRSHACSVPST
eukprot:6845150-Prymnesium_polylepis.1